MVSFLVMKSFKQHILEKLKVSSKSADVHKEYKNKTKEVTKYNAYKYNKYILDLDSIVLFMDYWYYFLESEDEELKERLDIHWDDIYLEIASGLNENRKELLRLIHDIDNEQINKVYITFKDRLTRFGFNYLKTMFENHGTEIIVLDDNEDTNKDYKTELIEDLISIIHHYSTKLYSNRRKELKEIEKILKNE